MKNKVVMVTGATNGIGTITARELARKGAQVVIVGRSQGRCDQTVADIKAQTGNQQVESIVADLSSLAGIRKTAETFLSRHQQLDVLLNNAGAVFNSREESPDGNEMTLALNHLNYFLLTHLLLDVLKQTAKQAGEARIVNVSSDAHYGAKKGINFDDIQRKHGYSGFGVYSESKLMNVMFTYELARRLEGTGITTTVLHPGFVATGFGHNNNALFRLAIGLVQRVAALTPEQGAETSIYLASSPEVKGVTGQYFEKSKVKKASSVSYDEAAQKRLWQITETLVGLPAVV
ncbi:MAG: SDR family oxidoreductase [Anaerolineae bacterium]|nr:SDR family oxidoreductase [Anaerolineae bacterium]